jgi:hypothetical protein
MMNNDNVTDNSNNNTEKNNNDKNNINKNKNKNINNNTNNNLNNKKILQSNKNDKTKIIIGTVNKATSKTTYGSIPRPSEKILLSTPPIPTNKNYFQRFDDVKSIFYKDNNLNPGSGSYDLSLNYFDKNKYKFKGNNYNDHSERFKSYYNGIPGVGDYNTNNNFFDNTRNIFKYNNLFTEYKLIPEINKDIINVPNSYKYNPYEFEKYKNKFKKINFNSYSSRSDFSGLITETKNNFPGPGYYNPNYKVNGYKVNVSMKERNKKNFILSSNNDLKLKTKKLLKKINNDSKISNVNEKSNINDENYNQDVNYDKTYFVLKNSKGGKVEKVQEINQIYKDLFLPIKNNMFINIINKNKEPKQILHGKIPLTKFKINQERELEYIKSILGNDNGKPDIFYLNQPRWKWYENKYQFKVPGPAYYYSDFKVTI